MRIAHGPGWRTVSSAKPCRHVSSTTRCMEKTNHLSDPHGEAARNAERASCRRQAPAVAVVYRSSSSRFWCCISSASFRWTSSTSGTRWTGSTSTCSDTATCHRRLRGRQVATGLRVTMITPPTRVGTSRINSTTRHNSPCLQLTILFIEMECSRNSLGLSRHAFELCQVLCALGTATTMSTCSLYLIISLMGSQ